MLSLLEVVFAAAWGRDLTPSLPRGVVVFATGVLGFGCSEANDVPPGCEDALLPRAEFPPCSEEGVCEEAREQRDRVVSWTLMLRLNTPDGMELSTEQFSHNRDCVMRQLQRLGYDIDFGDNEYGTLDASYAQIESVIRAPAIDGLTVECAGNDCDYCHMLSEQECTADVFCTPIDGRRLNTEAACYDTQFSGCMPSGLGCGDLVTNAYDPDNICWQFLDTCLPIDFVCTELCYEQFEEIEECGAR